MDVDLVYCSKFVVSAFFPSFCFIQCNSCLLTRIIFCVILEGNHSTLNAISNYSITLKSVTVQAFVYIHNYINDRPFSCKEVMFILTCRNDIQYIDLVCFIDDPQQKVRAERDEVSGILTDYIILQIDDFLFFPFIFFIYCLCAFVSGLKRLIKDHSAHCRLSQKSIE